MLCKDVMKSEVFSLSPQDTVELAARKMRDFNVGFLPICDKSGKVLGTLTDRDIALRVVAEGRTSDLPVEKFMSRDVIFCRPVDDLKRAEELMGQSQKSRILCIESGKLSGVISLSDLAHRDGSGSIQTMAQVTQREVRA
jgi:CBS domain-containing protein